MGLGSTRQNPPHIFLNHTEANELLNKWAACFSLMLITSCAVRLHRFQRLFNACTELRGCSNGSLKRKRRCWDRQAAWARLKDLQKWQATAEGMVLATSSSRNYIKKAFLCPLLSIFSLERGIIGTCHIYEFSFNSKGLAFIPAF